MVRSDHCFHTCFLSVCPSVRRPTFQKLTEHNKFQAKIMFASVETVGLAEWIIDYTCLVYNFFNIREVHLALFSHFFKNQVMHFLKVLRSTP